MPPSPRTVLVVCFGNLCRSPMAEALLRERLPAREWRVLSAGTHATTGHPPSKGAGDALARLAGLDLSGQRSALLTADMLRHADFVFAMSRPQARHAARLAPEATDKIRLLGGFAAPPLPHPGPADPGAELAGEAEIADPMGRGAASYEACCAHLIAATAAAADWLESGADPADAPEPLTGRAAR